MRMAAENVTSGSGIEQRKSSEPSRGLLLMLLVVIPLVAYVLWIVAAPAGGWVQFAGGRTLPRQLLLFGAVVGVGAVLARRAGKRLATSVAFGLLALAASVVWGFAIAFLLLILIPDSS